METTQDPDRRVEEARASLLAHVEELGRRIQAAKDKLDIRAHIAAHPRLAVGIAFAVGALLGFPGKRSSSSSESSKSSAVPTKGEVKSGLMGAAMATLGSLAFQLAKSVAFHQLSGQAKTWWDKNYGMQDAASRTRDVESFLEH